MTFAQLRAGRKTAYAVTAGLQHKNRGKPYVVIRLRHDLAARLGIKKGDKVMVFVGRGNDAGRVRLVKGDDAAYRVGAWGGHRNLRIEVPAWEGVARTPHRAQEAAHREIEGGLEIDLPPWAGFSYRRK